MGNVTAVQEFRVPENENRKVFVRYLSSHLVPGGLFGSYVEYLFHISYARWSFEIQIRFNDLLKFERRINRRYSTEMERIAKLTRPAKFFYTHDQRFLDQRAAEMTKFLQQVLDIQDILSCRLVYKFLNLGAAAFQAEYGRKGKEGFLKKSSGGYIEKFSGKIGDYIRVWRWRWIVLHDNCIVWYRNQDSDDICGVLQIDQDFGVAQAGRVITMKTGTRRLTFFAPTANDAREWVTAMQQMYGKRLLKNFYDSSFSPKMKNEVRVYCNGCEYFNAVAVALLSAQKEIFITSWKNSPTVLLTRPPLPPLRLDQILKYKADQGVAIFVLLYKEVEHIGQGNDSFNVMKKLERLSPNIHCIRHPNKFVGGATAVLWSHHEKLVIVDRNMAFVGGIDLAFQRWDNEHHLMADDDGLIYPGHDYRQPAPGVFKPVRVIDMENDANDSDEEMIEVVVARPGEALPTATTAMVDDDDQPLEVEVVVDFGMSHPNASVAPAETPNAPATPASHHPPHPPQRAAASVSTHGPIVRGMSGKIETGSSGTRQPEDDEISVADPSPVHGDNSNDIHATDEEAHAIQQQSDKTPRNPEDAEGARSTTFYDSFQQGVSATKSSLSYFGSTVSTYASQAYATVESYKEQYITQQKLKKSNYWETRDLYPRMGWHDVHCGISGRAARDVASHFVQRWNHHRLSTSNSHYPLLRDITDDMNFTVCARCQTQNIYETVQFCPNCGYDLGPVNSFSAPASSAYSPAPVDRYSYMIFECSFFISNKLPFRLHGDCPAVVTSIISSGFASGDSADGNKDIKKDIDGEGVILDLSGPMSEWLSAFGLYPAIGDVVATINGKCVSHLNSNQIKRLIKRIRKGLSSTFPNVKETYSIGFRRHYLENLHPIEKDERPPAAAGLMPESESNASLHSSSMAPTPAAEEVKSSEGEEKVPEEAPTRPSRASNLLAGVVPDLVVAEPDGSPDGGATPAAAVSTNEKMVYGPGEDIPPRDTVVIAEEARASQHPNKAAAAAGQVASSSAGDYHPICQAAAHMEISFNISKLFHEHAKFLECVPRLCNDQGSCKVQLLRSVGKWSIGTKPEYSILNCYIETIQNAHRFIYIENQFFIGSLAGDGTQNKIAEALMERILKAYEQKQPFRVIAVIPLHPNGDFANAMKSQVVMHYEYMTINRCSTSLIQQLKKRAPGINVSDYIGFYSLRNWGVINNKVVSDQIYVHDKLMIVDDRVMIIGSANINDRSMLGLRDSEIAVRIEDTLHVESMLNGQPHTVGFLPFSTRVKLMRQHLGNPSDIDLTDPLNPEVFKRWKTVAANNSASYDELDGPLSYYRCTGSINFRNTLEASINRSYLDPETRRCVEQIQGFLVDWPHNFFSAEDLSPSMATRAIIPNEMWL